MRQLSFDRSDTRKNTYSRGLCMVPIDVVYPVAWIKIIVRRDRGSNISDAKSSAKIRRVIKYLELVVMRVSEELGRDR